MRVFDFDALLSIEEARPETNNDVEEEKQVDEGVQHSDHVSSQSRMPLVFVKDLDWDDDRVVHGKDDDEVVPIPYECATSFENDLFSLLRLSLCLIVLRAGTVAISTACTGAIILVSLLKRGFSQLCDITPQCLSLINFTKRRLRLVRLFHTFVL